MAKMAKITQKNSPEYLTVKECQEICRFKGPDAIRSAIRRGELPAVEISTNHFLLIPSTDFWKWFHRNTIPSKAVQMPRGEIKKPKEKQAA